MALCGGIVLEEALNLSSDRILNDDDAYLVARTYKIPAIKNKPTL
jgi:hypothetical protein